MATYETSHHGAYESARAGIDAAIERVQGDLYDMLAFRANAAGILLAEKQLTGLRWARTALEPGDFPKEEEPS